VNSETLEYILYALFKAKNFQQPLLKSSGSKQNLSELIILIASVYK